MVPKSIKEWTISRFSDALRPLGAEIVRIDSNRFQIYDRFNESTLPDDAAGYLTSDNPRLVDLKQRYGSFDADVTTPFVWTEQHVRSEDLSFFRGDNAWVRQGRNRGSKVDALGSTLSLYYLKSIDNFGLFEKLDEDEKFGNFTFTAAGRSVSRELLDSVAEIYFLDRHLGVTSQSGLRVVDVGAGYGRLAYRMTTALPGIASYFCTDAVAVSTFVSEYYLRYRGAAKAHVVPLDEIDETLREHPVDLAINVHSFSECRSEAIEWWARLMSKHRVKKLMIVPNASVRGGEILATDDGRDMLPLFERYGYRTVIKEPKYGDPIVQEYGSDPTWHHLLALT